MMEDMCADLRSEGALFCARRQDATSSALIEGRTAHQDHTPWHGLLV